MARVHAGPVSVPAGRNTADTGDDAGVDAEVADALLAVLIRALRALGEAGHPEDANRLAARAWSSVRHQQPAAAARINGTMHYLARLPETRRLPEATQLPESEQ